jgi:PleD family two-component response regulator
MPRVLIVDEDEAHGRELAGRLQVRQLQVVSCTGWDEAMRILKSSSESFELVVLNLSLSPREGLECVLAINDLFLKLGRFPGPMILCASDHFFNPSFELELEASGARVVYER